MINLGIPIWEIVLIALSFLALFIFIITILVFVINKWGKNKEINSKVQNIKQNDKLKESNL